MKIEMASLSTFRQLKESGGIDEFVIQRFNHLYHLFAVNREAGVSYFLKERRGDYKTWKTLDRAAAFLFSINVSRFSVRCHQEADNVQ